MSMINLLPDEYFHQRSQHRTNVMCMVLLVILITGLVCAAIVSQRESDELSTLRDKVGREYAEAAKLIEQMHELEVRKRTMIRKAEMTASLLERVPRSYLLAVITRAAPESTSLTEFKLHPKLIRPPAPKKRSAGTRGRKTTKNKTGSVAKAALPPRPIVKVYIRVKGLAGTDIEVAKFISNLAANTIMKSVDLKYSQEKLIDGSAMREFQVEMELKHNVDVIDVLVSDEGPAGDQSVLVTNNTEAG